jgi:hypothetical protein
LLILCYYPCIRIICICHYVDISLDPKVRIVIQIRLYSLAVTSADGLGHCKLLNNYTCTALYFRHLDWNVYYWLFSLYPYIFGLCETGVNSQNENLVLNKLMYSLWRLMSPVHNPMLLIIIQWQIAISVVTGLLEESCIIASARFLWHYFLVLVQRVHMHSFYHFIAL